MLLIYWGKVKKNVLQNGSVTLFDKFFFLVQSLIWCDLIWFMKVQQIKGLRLGWSIRFHIYILVKILKIWFLCFEKTVGAVIISSLIFDYISSKLNIHTRYNISFSRSYSIWFYCFEHIDSQNVSSNNLIIYPSDWPCLLNIEHCFLETKIY